MRLYPQVTAEKTVVRRLLPEADAAATLNPAVAAAAASRTAASSGSQAGTLSKPCEALVALANPQDDYAIFASSWQATGIATQARFLEQKFGLSVSQSFFIVFAAAIPDNAAGGTEWVHLLFYNAVSC